MTTIYRAAESTELFAGAHFAATREEAEAYTTNPGFGGPDVFSVELCGEVAVASDLEELAELLVELGVEPPARWVENWDGDCVRVDGDTNDMVDAWRVSGHDYVFHVIENTDALATLTAAGYNWIQFNEPSLDGRSMSTTFRYLG